MQPKAQTCVRLLARTAMGEKGHGRFSRWLQASHRERRLVRAGRTPCPQRPQPGPSARRSNCTRSVMANSIGARLVVITGASAGVGRAPACAFARRGAAVGLIARGEAGLDGARRDVESSGGRAVSVAADVADANAVEAAASEVERQLRPNRCLGEQRDGQHVLAGEGHA